MKDYNACKKTLQKLNQNSDYYNEAQELSKSLE
jgi:uncharacterized membrane protein YgaE (UPF0421/DUF939 family)